MYIPKSLIFFLLIFLFVACGENAEKTVINPPVGAKGDKETFIDIKKSPLVTSIPKDSKKLLLEGEISKEEVIKYRLRNWFEKDPVEDDVMGVASFKALNQFTKNKSKPVIVAVLDDGIDVHHEDLKGKIWINTDEIPNNNIDDDNNGYIDDVHGWNFLGTEEVDLVYDTKSIVRKYKRLIQKEQSSSL
ncbi:MAG: hypothetical protein ACOCUV_02905, partial [bacterium]